MNNGNKELAAERHEKIRRTLKQKGIVTVEELCQELAVSAVTIRRDLEELDRHGRLRRVHGGAVSIDGSLDEPVFDDKADVNSREKMAIAAAALEFIKPKDSIILDGGSTILNLARLLADMANLTVVTNSLRVAHMFASGGPNTLVIGGELRRLSQTFVGPLTGALLERIHVDTAFMGTIGVTANEGMTTTDPREAQAKMLMMTRAHQVILLADSSKIGKISFSTFGGTDRIHTLITDPGVSPVELARLRKKGVKVVIAKLKGPATT